MGFLIALHIVICVFLVAIILIQPGKEDTGISFGSSGQSIFTSKTASNFLTKTTTVCAIIFLLTSFFLTRGRLKEYNESVISASETAESSATTSTETKESSTTEGTDTTKSTEDTNTVKSSEDTDTAKSSAVRTENTKSSAVHSSENTESGAAAHTEKNEAAPKKAKGSQSKTPQK